MSQIEMNERAVEMRLEKEKIINVPAYHDWKLG